MPPDARIQVSTGIEDYRRKENDRWFRRALSVFYGVLNLGHSNVNPMRLEGVVVPCYETLRVLIAHCQ